MSVGMTELDNGVGSTDPKAEASALPTPQQLPEWSRRLGRRRERE
jgi:hypothetical protein